MTERIVFVTSNYDENGVKDHYLKIGTYARADLVTKEFVTVEGIDEDTGDPLDQLLSYNQFIPVNWEI